VITVCLEVKFVMVVGKSREKLEPLDGQNRPAKFSFREIDNGSGEVRPHMHFRTGRRVAAGLLSLVNL
jgi:hypothetical protein